MKSNEIKSTYLFDIADSDKDIKTEKNLTEKKSKNLSSLKNKKNKDLITVYKLNTNSEKYKKLLGENNKLNTKLTKEIKITDKEKMKKYYDYLLILLSEKKVDPTVYNVVKKYDIDEIVQNEKFINKIRNDIVHNSKYEGTTDKEFISALTSKYYNQISKGQFMENLNHYSDRLRYYSKRNG